MAKETRGRPTSDTKETRQKIEEATAFDASIEEVAFYANISRETYYQIIKKDKVFSDRLDALRNRPVLKARQTVVESLGNPDLAFKYLEKKRRKEFGNALDLTTGGEKITALNEIQTATKEILNGENKTTGGEQV